MISITGNLEATWKNIRKAIFTKVIDFSTMPREAASLIGLSYYSTIIKPLLKIHKKYQETNNKIWNNSWKKHVKKHSPYGLKNLQSQITYIPLKH